MIEAIKGTCDILPPESANWQKVEAISREIFAKYGYGEIRTPIIEETSLFIKSVGEDTDIVKKEMFSFVDRGERNISLRPEGTAPIVRAYLEANLHKTAPFQKFYYIGPMFRAEKPQRGRSRQFHQIGLEAIGSNSAALDAEVICVLKNILDACGISGYHLKINNLGCHNEKRELSNALRIAFTGKDNLSGRLCDDCNRRLKTNPLRILDCKNTGCRAMVDSFKSTVTFCDSCKAHFDEVRRFLDDLKIGYEIDSHLVRGLDYYTKTVFEVTHDALGAQDAIGAGGRYDDLVKDMGGPELGACGFALGVERMMLALEEKQSDKKSVHKTNVFVATIGDDAYRKAISILHDLRNSNIPCDVDYEKRSLKSQMRSADSLNAKFVLIIGEDEIKKGEAVLRNMATKEQISIKFEDIVGQIKKMVSNCHCEQTEWEK